jgi:signal transduction histidine kinase
LNKKIILCVDDEKIVLESLRSELEGELPEPYALEFAESGDEALEVIADLIAKGDELVLIVTDYIMPGYKGDEVLIKVYEESPDSRQIMLTGQASLEGITNAINNAKLYRYISKPWEKSDLLLTIQEALKSHAQEMQIRAYQATLEATVLERTRDLETALDDLKNSQEQLLVSEKMAVLGGLVAGVAHEINTPVGIGVTAASHLETQVMEIARLHREGELTEEKYESFLKDAIEGSQIILRNLKTAAGLVSSFKLVAVDQSSEVIRDFNLNDYLHTIVISLQPELKQTRIAIDIDCPDDLIVKSYPGDYSQIFTNLIMNSVAHGFNQGADAGSIRIEVKKAGDAALIRYSDTGKGIASNIVRKVFDPFFTTNRQGGRSGLGMHIVYNIVMQKLEGTISCEDTAGQGALFIIRTPLILSKARQG